MVSRIFTALGMVMFFSSLVLAQQAACKADIPVGVIGINGDTFRGLAAEDFIGQIQKKPVAVKKIAFDDGPRRVLIVADVSKKLSADSRKAEDEMIKTLVASARPGDTFAIMPAHGPGQDVKFTEDRAAIREALNQPGEGKRGKEPGVLDTVMVGIEWFGPPQPGDSIVVIAADMQGSRKANARMVAKALHDNHIRLFGLALGPVQTKSTVAGGFTTSASSQGLAQSEPLVGELVYETGDENFFPLTTNSGGLVLSAMNGDARRNYSMGDPKMVQSVRQKAHSVANMISAYYRMQVEPPPIGRPEDWSLTINQELQKHAQPMFVLYPHELGPC
ncbi:MAG TPA: hypothetical protein VHV32_13060 [Candidatus Angelobacter sp.]|jgi:hypothetical protein|nr:hypothetical protein [Candidatus Angelobacter sp.]